MSGSNDSIMLPLFVPGDRPERFAKALAAGADAVIIDLEDAVPASAKEFARDGLATAIGAFADRSVPLLVRVNAVGTPWYQSDLAACVGLPLTAIMLPKAETLAGVQAVAQATGLPVFALIESAIGLCASREIAGASARLAFGSIDFAADIGCVHSRDTLLAARSALVIASRVAGLAPPIDGVTAAIHDASEIESDARYGASLGFGGKLLIHPAQIAPARQGLAPSESEIAWAQKIVSSGGSGAAVAVDGAMVDVPVLIRAKRILERQG